jgi:hypothetical protein
MMQKMGRQARADLELAMIERQGANQSFARAAQSVYASGGRACWMVFDQSNLFRDGNIVHMAHLSGFPDERTLPWQLRMCGKHGLSVLKCSE